MAGSRALVGAYLLVALAALAVRARSLVENPTPDAAEYEMIARSLARGEGFTLPVRVRHDQNGPTLHDARGERAPLFPLSVSLWVRAGLDDGRAGFAPGLQAANALVGVLDALLVASLAVALARRRPSPGEGAPRRLPDAAIGFAAGLVTAWSPPLVHTSVHILSEPLGLLFVLLAAKAEVALSGGNGKKQALALGAASGLALGLARLARGEASFALIVVLLLRVEGLLRKRPGALLALAGTLACAGAVSGAAVALGVGAAQSFLLRVTGFMDVMFGYGKAEPPAASVVEFVLGHKLTIAANVAANAGDYGFYLLKQFWACPLLAALAVFRGAPGERRIALLGWGLLGGAILVWATKDHSRFTAAPVALLAGPAALEGDRLLASFFERRPRFAATTPRALTLAGLLVFWAVCPLWHEARETWKAFTRPCGGEDLWHGPHMESIGARLRSLPEGEAFAAVSPWGLSLASGKPGLLLPNELEPAALRAFLDAHRDVAVVVLRPDLPADRRGKIKEPLSYREDLAAITSAETVAGAELLFLERKR